jgi:hypothetical protein
MNWGTIAIIGAVLIGGYIVFTKAVPGGIKSLGPTIAGLGGEDNAAQHLSARLQAGNIKPIVPAGGGGREMGQVSSRFSPGMGKYTIPNAPTRKGKISSRFPKTAGTQGNCQFTSPTTVCWASGGFNTCNTFNAKSSDSTSVSGRQTLCSRVRAKFMAQHTGSQSLSYVGQRIGVA